jgi:hypothetical protein
LSCLQIVFFAVFLLTFLVGKLGGWELYWCACVFF